MHPRFDVHDVAGSTKGAIESFDYIDALPGLVPHPRPQAVPRGSVIAVAGWAVVSPKGDASSAITAVLDGHRPHAAECGLARTDIAIKHRTAENVGYRCIIPTDDILAGAHEVRILALGLDGRWLAAAHAAFHVYDGGNPHLPPHPRALRIAIDYAGELHGGEAGNGAPIACGRFASIAGWMFDPVTLAGPAGVIAMDESGRTWSGPCGIARSDVAAMLGVVNNAVGFEIIVPTAVLGRGLHVVRVAAFGADGRSFANREEVTLNVAGTARRFPLTARIRTSEPVFGATVSSSADDPDARSLTLPERNATLRAVRGDVFFIEGWATAANGSAADEVYVEAAPIAWVVPPLRFAAVAGFHRLPEPDCAPERAPDDGWFTCALDTRDLPDADYQLSLVVVDPDRRIAARAHLATVHVSDRPGAEQRRDGSSPRSNAPEQR